MVKETDKKVIEAKGEIERRRIQKAWSKAQTLGLINRKYGDTPPTTEDTKIWVSKKLLRLFTEDIQVYQFWKALEKLYEFTITLPKAKALLGWLDMNGYIEMINLEYYPTRKGQTGGLLRYYGLTDKGRAYLKKVRT